MSFDLLDGLPPVGDAEFDARKAKAVKFAARLPIVRTFGPRNGAYNEHWSAYFARFLFELYFDPKDEGSRCREYEKICPSDSPRAWVYFHGGRPDHVYGECVFVLKSDLPPERHADVSATPFGLPNLVGRGVDFTAEDATQKCLLIEPDQWCSFLKKNTWNGANWRERLANYYNYQLECDSTIYFWIDPVDEQKSNRPRRLTTLGGKTLWPETIEDYRAWTVELRLHDGLRLKMDPDHSFELYFPTNFKNWLRDDLPIDSDPVLYARKLAIAKRVEDLAQEKRLFVLTNAVVDAARAIATYLSD